MHSLDMLVPPTENKEVEKVEKNNEIDFSEISASFKEIVENQKEVNEKIVNSINEVKELEKNNDIDFSEITATFKEVVENQKEVNEKIVNSINEVANKLTSTEKKEESEVEENEWC